MTLKSIRSLRQRVASCLEDSYWRGEEVRGLDVRQIVKEAHKGIKDYVHDLKGQQWASPVEIALALDILQISACVCAHSWRVSLDWRGAC